MSKGTFLFGTGTESDPYIVEDVYDFCAIKNDDDKDITYYQLGKSLDFNDHDVYKNGFKGGVVVNANKSVLDGNGKEIRNIVGYNNSVGSYDVLFTLKEINNCKFANTISFITTRVLFLSEFKRCSFFFMISNASLGNLFRGDSTGNCKFTECTLTFSGNSGAMDFSRNVFARCKIVFKDFSAKLTSGYNSVHLITNGNFDHTYFLGKIDVVNSSNTSRRNIFNGTISNVYFAVEADLSGGSESTQESYVCNGSVLASSFADKDLLPYLNAKNSGGGYYLTTENCKTTSELIKIGFPVIGL